MRLDEILAMQKLSAGGPGSGRHAGGGVAAPAQPAKYAGVAHDQLAKFHGYTPNPEKPSQYTKNGHALSVEKDGSWNHTSDKGKATSGKDYKSMVSRLGKLHGDRFA